MEREKCIFDMDGTLVDSMRYWRRLERDFLTQRGVSIPDMERVPSLFHYINQFFCLLNDSD